MIKDFITPTGFDLTKDLHGHVRVETRSRWTGKIIDSQEKDNLVTNAIANVYKVSRAAATPLWSWFSPIYSKALGGLLLFDNTLTESADNVHFPGSVKLVGYAGQTADTSHAMAGSMNSSESVFTSNGFTAVWDFLTSQANGTIGSVARTSYLFMSRGIAGRDSSEVFPYSNLGPYSLGSAMAILGYDKINKYLYLACPLQQTYNGAVYPTNKIYRVYCDFETQPLLNQYLISNPDKWTEVLTVSSSTDGTSGAYQFMYDPHSDNFYFGASGSTKKIYLITPSGTRSSITVPANISNNYQVAATASYYWYVGASNTIYRVKKSNPSDTDSVVLTFAGSKILALADDCVMVGGGAGTYNRALIYSDLNAIYLDFSNALADGVDILAPTAPAYGRGPMILGDYLGCPSSTSTPLLPLTGYLGTIANLDSPVTKTSSQTMKVTYTLTEA